MTRKWKCPKCGAVQPVPDFSGLGFSNVSGDWPCEKCGSAYNVAAIQGGRLDAESTGKGQGCSLVCALIIFLAFVCGMPLVRLLWHGCKTMSE